MSKQILGIFNGSDLEGISALIDTLEKSSFDYLRLEGDGINLVIGKNGAGEAAASVAAAVGATVAAAPVAFAAPAPAPAEAPAPVAAPAAAEKPVVSEEAGITVVKSPSYGLFYAQPEPGAPPYVKLGDRVKQGDTVGLVEIMKTFNAISAPCDGEVVGIHVKNEEMLEPEQPLVSIKAN